MKQIRDAVEYIKKALPCYTEEEEKYHVKNLIDIAEKVLAVKMPEKKEILEGEDVECFTANDMNRAYNKAIDDCRIAFTGKLLSVEEIYQKIIEFRIQKKIIDASDCYDLAEKIHKAQQDKQEV